MPQPPLVFTCGICGNDHRIQDCAQLKPYIAQEKAMIKKHRAQVKREALAKTREKFKRFQAAKDPLYVMSRSEWELHLKDKEEARAAWLKVTADGYESSLASSETEEEEDEIIVEYNSSRDRQDMIAAWVARTTSKVEDGETNGEANMNDEIDGKVMTEA